MGALDIVAPLSRVTNRYLQAMSQQSPTQMVKSVFVVITSHMIVKPLANLYLKGPTFFGFWGGMDLVDICQHLSNNSPSRHFANADGSPTDQCLEMINNKFYSWIIMAYTLIYMYMLFYFGRMCYRWVSGQLKIPHRMRMHRRRRSRRQRRRCIAYHHRDDIGRIDHF